MKSRKMKRMERGMRWREALARGTLVWGSVYATGASALTYVITPMVSDERPMYSELFLEALLIFPLCGTAAGYADWKVRKYLPTLVRRLKRRKRRIDRERFLAHKRHGGVRPRHA